MASSKNFIFWIVILVITAVSVNAKSYYFGYKDHYAKLACYGNAHLAAEPGKVVSATRVCKVRDPNQRISYISAQDQGSLGRGGYAQITNGGLHQDIVTVYMWSQPGQPLDFDLNVYAKNRNLFPIKNYY